MPVFPKPRTRYVYDVDVELRHVALHRMARGVPRKGPDRLLLGSWNIANFGAQVRRESDLRLLAEVLSWWDLVAVQRPKRTTPTCTTWWGTWGRSTGW